MKTRKKSPCVTPVGPDEPRQRQGQHQRDAPPQAEFVDQPQPRAPAPRRRQFAFDEPMRRDHRGRQHGADRPLEQHAGGDGEIGEKQQQGREASPTFGRARYIAPTATPTVRHSGMSMRPMRASQVKCMAVARTTAAVSAGQDAAARPAERGQARAPPARRTPPPAAAPPRRPRCRRAARRSRPPASNREAAFAVPARR